MDPKKRINVKAGLKVNIVLKADQRTNKLTQGIVKDVNIVTIKELLGHANIQTTMIYTNPNQKEVQKAYLNAIK